MWLALPHTYGSTLLTFDTCVEGIEGIGIIWRNEGSYLHEQALHQPFGLGLYKQFSVFIHPFEGAGVSHR